MKPYWTNGKQTLYLGHWALMPKNPYNCIVLDPPVDAGIAPFAIPAYGIYFGLPVRSAMLEMGEIFRRVSLWFPSNLPSGMLRPAFLPIWTTPTLDASSTYTYPLDITDGARKPVELLTALLASDEIGAIQGVFDPFAGSGSTLEACARLKLPCIGFEINEEKCEAAAKKLEAACH